MNDGADQSRAIKRVPTKSDWRMLKINVAGLTLLILCPLLLAVGVHRYLYSTFNGSHRLAVLEMDEHRKVELWTENFNDPTGAGTVTYKLIIDGKLGVMGLLGYLGGNEGQSFRLLQSKDSSVAAIVEKSNSDVVLFLYDFNTKSDCTNLESDSSAVRSAFSKLSDKYPNLIMAKDAPIERELLIRGG